jgi:photosystem II stability/assembly factor-like uncharacterized protein
MKHLSVLFLLFPVCLFSQWNVVNVNQSTTLNCVHYLDANNVFIGGDSLTYTNNGGGNWINKPIHDGTGTQIPGTSFFDLHFTSSTTGLSTGAFYSGNSYEIANTVNSGVNWSFVFSSNNNLYPRALNKFSFPSASTGFAAGTNGYIYKTTNGGTTWSLLNTGVTVELYSVCFPSTAYGYACGLNKIIRTSNGGSTWTSVTVAGYIREMYFSNDSTGYATGDDFSGIHFYKTTNYGATWTAVSHPFFNEITALTGHGDTLALACNGIYYSTNGGQWWNYFPTTSSYIIEDIKFLGRSNDAYAVGDNGIVLHTTNINTAPMYPVAAFTSSGTTLCAGDSLHFTNTGNPAWTYQWKRDNTLITTAYSTYIVFPSSGVHTVSLIANNGTGTDTASFSVTVNPLPYVPPFTSQVNTDPICSGSSTGISVFSSTNGVTYKLRNGTTQIGATQNGNGGTLTFNTGAVATTTVFNILATNAVACGTTTSIVYDTVHIDVVNTSLQVTALTDSVCNGSPATILVHNSILGVTYKLRTGSMVIGSPQTGNGSTLSFTSGNLSANTTFNIYATDPPGCSAQLSQTISITVISVNANITVSLPYTNVNDAFTITNSSTASDYSWTCGPNSSPATSTSITPVVTWSAPGVDSVFLQVSSNPGCIDRDTLVMTVCAVPSVGTGVTCFDHDVKLRSYTVGNPGYQVMDYCSDQLGNSYATGFYDTTMGWGVNYNMFIAKFGPTGNLVWFKKQNPFSYPVNQYRSSFGNTVECDGAGNLYVGGCFAGVNLNVDAMTIATPNYTGYEKGFLIKFDPNGTPLWNIAGYGNAAVNIGGAVTDIVVKDNNNIYFSAGGAGSSGLIWHFTDGSTPVTSGHMQVMHINGNGGFMGVRCGDLDPSGISYYSTFNPNISAQNADRETFVSPRMELLDDTLYVGTWNFGVMDFGTFTVPVLNANAVNGVITKMNTVNDSWVNAISTFSNDVGAQGAYPIFTLDDSANFYVGWNWNASPTVLYLNNQPSVPNSKVNLLAKYSRGGDLLWSNVSNSTMHTMNMVYLEGTHELITYGYYGDFSPYAGFLDEVSQSGGPFGFPSRGDHDMFLSSYSPNGSLNYTRHIGGTGLDNPFFVRKFNCEQVGIIGQSNAVTMFDTDTIANYNNNMFVVKFAPTGNCGIPTCITPLSVQDVVDGKEVEVYPNPVSNELNIDCAVTPDDRKMTAIITDLLGQVLIEREWTFDAGGEHHASLNVGELPNGTYLLSVKTSFGIETKKIIISH